MIINPSRTPLYIILSKASIYGRLEVEAMLLEREASWKREDIEKMKAIGDARRQAEELRLAPKREEKNALLRELESIQGKIREMEEKEGNAVEEQGVL